MTTPPPRKKKSSNADDKNTSVDNSKYTANPEPAAVDPMDLFRQAVGEVKPVRNDRVNDTSARPPPRPRQFELDEQAVMHDAMTDNRDPDDMDTGEHLNWARAGVQKRVMRKLRNGYYSVQAELDLHGLTINQARAAMQDFIHDVTATNGSCCVRIIHGKGRKSATDAPILKPFTASYLRQRKDVLAYCSAKSSQGGTGAVYVLLRAQQNN